MLKLEESEYTFRNEFENLAAKEMLPFIIGGAPEYAVEIFQSIIDKEYALRVEFEIMESNYLNSLKIKFNVVVKDMNFDYVKVFEIRNNELNKYNSYKLNCPNYEYRKKEIDIKKIKNNHEMFYWLTKNLKVNIDEKVIKELNKQ